jgi:hypothetical protein
LIHHEPEVALREFLFLFSPRLCFSASDNKIN